jgi:hypothetical protein
MLFGRSFHDHKAIMRITVQFSSLFRTLAGVEQEALDVDEGTTIDRLAGILLQNIKTSPSRAKRPIL